MITFLFLVQKVTHGLALVYPFNLICWYSFILSTFPLYPVPQSFPASHAFQARTILLSHLLIRSDWVHPLPSSGPFP